MGFEMGGREDCKQGHCFSRWEISSKAVMRMHNDSNKLDGARRSSGLSEKYETEKSITPLFFFSTFIHCDIHPEWKRNVSVKSFERTFFFLFLYHF